MTLTILKLIVFGRGTDQPGGCTARSVDGSNSHTFVNGQTMTNPQPSITAEMNAEHFELFRNAIAQND
ncbi:hypothetical protein [Ruegeria lacuscaerulensis]|uniref:hypothetical protein n=1 Tax=Ruegeria lacuscaerulensis TaxID=55218 RepID=UPI00147B90DF|nr:hypothetical protein [Ruegeria lacuscaerulensis]